MVFGDILFTRTTKFLKSGPSEDRSERWVKD